MRRTLLLVLALLGLTGGLAAQSPFSFAVHGFVNPHYYADSRAVVGGREDMMLFFPKPVERDANGNDINAGWRADMLAITTRLGVMVKGPDALGAKTAAYIEGDFTGATNATINNLRLRHAYFTLDWGKHRLLAGQYWHPMVVHEVMPGTNPLNMGAPFHPYARYNQVRYDAKLWGLHLIGVACWQLDNASQGLLQSTATTSTAFARHSLLPELNAQLRYDFGALKVGAAVNALTIQPMSPVSTLNDRLHTSVSYSLYALLNVGRFTLRAQTLLNNSMYEICSLGGYYITPEGDVHDWHFNTVWIDADWRCGKWRPGLFAGYARNQSSGLQGMQTFGRGADITSLWRVQPRLTYQAAAHLGFTAEAELTEALYASGTEPRVDNLRLSLSAVYAF